MSLEVFRLPALTDNYIFLLYDPGQQIAAVVDPAEPQPVLAKLDQLNVPLVAIFNTHHHGDHVGANRDLLAKYPQLQIYGGDRDRGRIPGQQFFLTAGDQVRFGDQVAEVFFIPGHTHAHIAYYFAASGDLFCGDTLFAGGCGRLFEGTPAQMCASLHQLRQLPDQTRVWCAHEYTLSNLKFAIAIEPDNLDLQARLEQVQIARSQDQPTIPTTIGLEKRTNPFLRWEQPAVQQKAGGTSAVEVFATIRALKDVF
ncbi:MAG: hydroxyacylglutathione hydrolase [Pseudanabaenaceae cyanobacterium bins.68]|nr:hydroxyacylglutathione hydrolase [Pseudanabaenaceae cyanobacterium bins.68]